MSFANRAETDESAIPGALRAFFRNRFMEASGLFGLGCIGGLAIALATWTVNDPSLNNAVDALPRNAFGYPGAVLADELMQAFGMGVIGLMAAPTVWAMGLLVHRPLLRFPHSLVTWILCALALAATLSALPVPARWALASGLGGNIGDMGLNAVVWILSFGLKGPFATFVGLLVLGCCAVWFFFSSINHSHVNAYILTHVIGERGHDVVDACVGAMGHWLFVLATAVRRAFTAEVPVAADDPKPSLLARIKAWFGAAPEPEMLTAGDRLEPILAPAAAAKRRRPAIRKEEPAPAEDEEEDEDDDEEEAGEDEDLPPVKIKRPATTAKPAPQKKVRIARANDGDFEMPPLTLLSEPKHVGRKEELSDEALEQNARMLEGVLDDFGVRGEIVNVHPGPVVTLYELEPAPGIKSSRVIGLSDDIARSMSAVSTRVAVVPGRNAIGIELPNVRRETVYLRELFTSPTFEKANFGLALALGKNIGGEPVFADLARMPHLLIAGTTGSGKSVGINTMILSLLYRLSPKQCRLIMIDPKMLELSVYEGIPHLLAPVVTDPRKAIVALKWAVREMEDRYRKMSKLGVRNIDGYNSRVQQTLAKGETMKRRVQTGYDPTSGEPIFEEEEIDLQLMPYIVVIIDEMADLMMVAGKDIEGAVQRLAQMARAAGIHVVMATQRPSVDVITGTIKANFPTRISFQVTSKIDSRTILGEQGAEQLLGQGDMLYMAGGGRISRLHGPFVSDDEVEKIVRFLKEQGAPEYVEAVTAEPEEGELGALGESGEGGSGDALYDQAVAVVLRDKKVSTSYIQRRLQIGYNKAASLIERMENEGLISQANATGKREILVGDKE